jgi:hypothetical protein
VVLSLLLVACGGGGSSGAREQSLAQQPDEKSAETSVPEDVATVETANPQEQEQPQEPVAAQPAGTSQTRWTVGVSTPAIRSIS